ncbi:hypothetical protein GCM10028777_37890 [Angustibacter speluncae]
MNTVLRTTRALATTLLCLVVLLLAATMLLPRAFGLDPLVVTSGSMSPTVDPGAVVLVGAPTRELAEDDVVTFRDGTGGLTTHRIASVLHDADGTPVLVTRGDANEDADPSPLAAEAVVGVARFAVPHVGYLVQSASTPAGIGVLLALVGLSLVRPRGPRARPALAAVPA